MCAWWKCSAPMLVFSLKSHTPRKITPPQGYCSLFVRILIGTLVNER